MEAETSRPEAGGPVTVVVTRQPRRGYEAAFEEWLRGVLDEAAAFPGHEGTSVIRPTDPARPEYVLILRFAAYDDLVRWYESEERARWLEKVEPISETEPEFHEQTGLETWFTLPGRKNPAPPSRPKMAILTLLGIYPLVLLANVTLVPALESVARPLAALVTSAVLVVLMTWVVMPAVTKVLYGWLYPETRKGRFRRSG